MFNFMYAARAKRQSTSSFSKLLFSTSRVSNNKDVKVAVYSCKPYDASYLTAANKMYGFDLDFHNERLNAKTAIFADGAKVVCSFVNDSLQNECLKILHNKGTRFIALRCAGFDSVCMKTAADLDIDVARVPRYSPYAVAEHAIALILTLNRNTHKAYNRVRDNNFSLDGLLGFDMYGKTAGIVGTGKIGSIAAHILRGFGCNVIAYDQFENEACLKDGVEYVPLSELFARSDIISLHAPLTPESHHLINKAAIDMMKPGVVLINTSRGGLVDTEAIIDGLRSQKIARLGLDVYEKEQPLFFEDLSGAVPQDDTFQRLQSFPNVLITGHQAFFTHEALTNIAECTLSNINDFVTGKPCPNLVNPAQKKMPVRAI